MNTIINAIPEYVITAVVSTAIYYAIKMTQNFIHVKALHAKAAQAKELWNFLDQVSSIAVNSLVSSNLTGNAKFNQATGIVQSVLVKQGLTNVDVKAIETAVQNAYEQLPTTAKMDNNYYDFAAKGDTKAIDPTKEA
ncbi:hypothetical protein FC35_GL000696 [Limosilactobacillus coleohominis DSM 14060]|nr:hypothetical protein FC35_GL000696 [Limosilactobacillus coleohominis DSM 14060]